VLDLSQLFVERGTFHFSSSLSEIAIHESIFVDEVTLSDFHNLDGHNQRNRYHGIDKHKVAEE